MQLFELMRGNKANILLKNALRNAAECVPVDQELGAPFVK